MPQLILRVGNKGAGKTTGAVAECLRVHIEAEKAGIYAPIITNTPVWWRDVSNEEKRRFRKGEKINKPGAILKRESLRWLAVKTVLKDDRYAYILTDEAAMAEDLESRGSSSYATAPKTYLVALSRKTNVDIDVISQLMSMTDKRIQWLADIPLLCIAHPFPDSDLVDYFEYQVYDPSLDHVVSSYELDALGGTRYCSERLFAKFDTGDVPLSDDKIATFEAFFNITETDKRNFYLDMGDTVKLTSKIERMEQPWYHPYRFKDRDLVRLKGDEIWRINGGRVYSPESRAWEYSIVREVEVPMTKEELREQAKEIAEHKRQYLRSTREPSEVVKELFKNDILPEVNQEDIKEYKKSTGLKD